jgi:anti-sigma-K factor RskA
MNLRENERLLEKLASEYVLGTLRDGARRRFEATLKNDPVVQRAVAEWQDRLHPMAEFATAIQPPPQVWRAIVKKLNLHPVESNRAKRSFWLNLRKDLSFWRGLGMTSTALAIILVSVLLGKQAEPVAPVTSYIALLADNQAQPIAIVTGDARRHELTIKVVARQTIAADKSLELWAVPQQGSPRSLGRVADNGSIMLPLPENATPQSIPLLVVTLEPKGGSPNPNRPTGPILFKGAWLQI